MQTPPVLVFDGNCGFCTWSVNQVKRWIRPRVQIVDWQRSDLDALGLTTGECMTAVQFVRRDGTHSAGARAASEVLREAPIPWPLVGILMQLPVAAFVADRAYKMIAANRDRLPGATPACQISAAA